MKKGPFVYEPARGRQDKPSVAAQNYDGFEGLTVKELKALLAERDVAFAPNAKKAELLELLEAALLAEAEAGV